MKKILFFVGLMLCVSCDKDDIVKNDDIELNATVALVESDAVLRGWSKQYNCLANYGTCAIAIEGDSADRSLLQSKGMNFSENEMKIKIRLMGGSEMIIINQLDKLSEDGNYIEFESDFRLPEELAERLGKEEIIIVAGKYETVFTEDYPFGKNSVSIR